MNMENMKNNIINKFDKKEENFEEKTVVLVNKINSLLSHPAITINDFAGIREHLGSAFNIVNNELPENPEKLELVQDKLMRIGDGYDISGSEFESFRRELAAAIDYSHHNME